ncbi:hypothetical protein L2E82_25148 [Cichorium intybus]|uniref:Uncharacterized protein n=1 Tax=Cichorium intybus TaxID=13427 RepID=A0ACB9E391_CICIN|nr:hypothetical protein L2E82_25148 [Cichorium intybus]
MLSPSSTVSTVSTPSPQMFLLLLVDTSSDHNLHHTEQPPPTIQTHTDIDTHRSIQYRRWMHRSYGELCIGDLFDNFVRSIWKIMVRGKNDYVGYEFWKMGYAAKDILRSNWVTGFYWLESDWEMSGLSTATNASSMFTTFAGISVEFYRGRHMRLDLHKWTTFPMPGRPDNKVASVAD